MELRAPRRRRNICGNSPSANAPTTIENATTALCDWWRYPVVIPRAWHGRGSDRGGIEAADVGFYRAHVDYTTRALDAKTWSDFAALVEAHNGVWGGCWCMGFHPEGVRKGHTPEGNRAAKRARTVAGTVHQILVYADTECVGWCQYGTPAELPNINNKKAYELGVNDPPTWRIGCIFTANKQRGKGIARAAVAAALEAIGQAGGGTVEAYPEQTAERPPQRGAYLHTGPVELFEQFGFVRDRKIAKWRWVMRAEVPNTAPDQRRHSHSRSG